MKSGTKKPHYIQTEYHMYWVLYQIVFNKIDFKPLSPWYGIIFNPVLHCPFVHLLVGHTLLFFMIFILWWYCSCLNALVTSNTAPAYPHATWMYSALLSLQERKKRGKWWWRWKYSAYWGHDLTSNENIGKRIFERGYQHNRRTNERKGGKRRGCLNGVTGNSGLG